MNYDGVRAFFVSFPYLGLDGVVCHLQGRRVVKKQPHAEKDEPNGTETHTVLDCFPSLCTKTSKTSKTSVTYRPAREESLIK